VKGIKARGDFKVDIEWKDGKLVKSTIYAGAGGNCRVRGLQPVKVIEVRSTPASGENPNPFYSAYDKPPYEKNAKAQMIELKNEAGYIIDFTTVKGRTYTIVPL
jgi:alpha-L-fucosidase 2